MIITKNVIELIEYEKLNTTGNLKPDMSSIKKGTGILNAQNYVLRVKKRRDEIRRLVTMNFDNNCIFITLTYKDNITDIKISNKEFKKFIQRLKRAYPEIDIKYLSVIEFQKRGAIHYHMIVNIRFVNSKDLERLWGLGFVKISVINQVDNVGAYLVKYMSKDLVEPRLMGLKAYNCSKGLDRPIELKSWNNEDALINQLFAKFELNKKMPVYSSKYTSVHAGQIAYQQYNEKRDINNRH